MECEVATQLNPLQQGDVIVAQPGTENWANPWSRFGVILTADCDIAQNKNDSKLIYAPILTHDDYVCRVWIPKIASKALGKADAQLSRRLSEFDMNLKSHQIEQFLGPNVEDTVEQLGHAFSNYKTPPTKTFLVDIATQLLAINALRNLSFQNESAILAPAFSSLVQYGKQFASDDLGDATKTSNSFKSAFLSLLTALDYAVLTRLVGLDKDMPNYECEGFAVAIRRFSTVDISNVLTDKTKWYAKPQAYFRACRLRPIYRFDLINQFANLFVRVGLEDERKDEYKRLSAENGLALAARLHK